MIDTAELHRRIADRAEDFGRELFGDAARRSGNGWGVGRRHSLKIKVVDGKLLCADHENGGGGDAVWLWQRERGGTDGEALRACAAWAGLGTDAPPPAPRTERPAPPAAPVPLPDMPQGAADAWTEGREYLLSNPAACEEIAEWRGLPVEYVATLAGAGIISAPIWWRERARIAFPTCEPVPWPAGEGEPLQHAHRDRARFVGFHARMRDRDGEPRGWRFVPRQDDTHPGLRPLPILLSRAGAFGQISDKRLLIITEGEFDLCTLPLALGWFDPILRVLRIPSAVALCGIVGAAAGPRAFLDAFRPYWPSNAAALVLRDGDKAGDRWTEPGGFLAVLRDRCSHVASAHFGTAANGRRRDVNDAWRDGSLSRSVIDAQIRVQMGRTLRDAEIAEPRDDTPPQA